MILDKLSNAALYEQVNPRFAAAFKFLNENDLLNLPAGKVHLEGDNLFVNILDFQGKEEKDAKMETHNDYIDIQIPINGTETMGWTPTVDLNEVTHPYNPEKDVTFFADKAVNMLTVEAGTMAIFFPEDGHQPGIAPGKSYRKIIVKVRV